MKKFFAFLVKPNGPGFKWFMIAVVGCIVALGLFGYLSQVIAFLDSEALTFKFGKTPISLYRIIKSIFVVVVLFWAAGLVSDYGERHIKALRNIKSSNRAIISKAFQIFLYFIVFMIMLEMLDIDLKALAIFSGAVGIGIGFGLQKITSNFISGLILLFEKSVRVDDIVEMDGGIYGYLRHTGARYTLVEAPDGREIMIPNEDFITGRVTNWTYSNLRGRIEVQVGVSYESDLEKAKKLMLEAALEHPKCNTDPRPQCFLRTFSENAVNFTLFFWVGDVTDGRFEPQSDVMISIWKKFKANGIVMPSPQMEVHVKNLKEIAGK